MKLFKPEADLQALVEISKKVCKVIETIKPEFAWDVLNVKQAIESNQGHQQFMETILAYTRMTVKKEQTIDLIKLS